MSLHNLRSSALALVLLSSTAVPIIQPAHPRRDFREEDFARLRWIEGTWKGTGSKVPAFYERYRFANDSTVEITAFRDASMKAVKSRSTFALRAGRIIHESGSARYHASKVNSGIAHFLPVRGASSAFQFTRMSRDRWTATIQRSKVRKRTVYEMRRVQ